MRPPLLESTAAHFTVNDMSLAIKNIHISADNQPIVHGLSLEIQPGELHVIMGPNGSGKSTLANALGGHPAYTITKGNVLLDGADIGTQKPDARAKAGLFLSMQHIPAIPGVSISNFLRIAYDAQHGTKSHPVKFHKELVTVAERFGIDAAFLKRHLGAGLSGGEKKRVEMLQLSVLQPRYAILDETDSGLDVDALKVVSGAIAGFRSQQRGVLLITHYDRFLEALEPDQIHVMMGGRIVQSGGPELAATITAHGYQSFV